MRILGIDGGTWKTGWVIYDTIEHRVEGSGVTENEEFLEFITSEATDRVDTVAMEDVRSSFGKPAGAELFSTSFLNGRVFERLRILRPNVPVFKLARTIDVKPTICGTNNAKDPNVRQAILEMFPQEGGGKTPAVGTKGQPGRLYGISSHAWSALAVALTHALKHDLIERKVYV